MEEKQFKNNNNKVGIIRFSKTKKKDIIIINGGKSIFKKKNKLNGDKPKSQKKKIKFR